MLLWNVETLLKALRPEDEGTDLWTTMNRLQENLVQGGLSDFHRDRRGRLRSVRALRGIDSKVSDQSFRYEAERRSVKRDALSRSKPIGDKTPQFPGRLLHFTCTYSQVIDYQWSG